MIGIAKESEVLCYWGILIEHDGKDYPSNAFAILTTPVKADIRNPLRYLLITE